MTDELPTDRPIDDEALRRVAEALRRTGPADRALDARLVGFEARVLAAVASPERSEPEAPVRGPWLLRPRTLHVRPIWALAAAAALLVAFVGGARLMRPVAVLPEHLTAAPLAATGATPARDTVRLVQFVLLAPRAGRVELVGDFNGWRGTATPMRRTASGLWAVELPLSPGRYTYTFVVDGTHFTPDPAAPRALGDDFGTPSSVVTVAGGNT